MSSRLVGCPQAGPERMQGARSDSTDTVQRSGLRRVRIRSGVPGCNPSVRPAAGHYYGSRDDLIAAMITDAFDELARATSAAVGNRRAGDAAWIAVVLAYRTWALLNPELFSLMHSRTATRLKDRNNGNSRRQATGPTTPPTDAGLQFCAHVPRHLHVNTTAPTQPGFRCAASTHVHRPSRAPSRLIRICLPRSVAHRAAHAEDLGGLAAGCSPSSSSSNQSTDPFTSPGVNIPPTVSRASEVTPR